LDLLTLSAMLLVCSLMLPILTEEVSFHLNTCRLCVDSTQSQLKCLGISLTKLYMCHIDGLCWEAHCTC
jgi:hypothetical protein